MWSRRIDVKNRLIYQVKDDVKVDRMIETKVIKDNRPKVKKKISLIVLV